MNAPHQLSNRELAAHLESLAARIAEDVGLRQKGSNRSVNRAVLGAMERARAFQDAACLIRLNEREWDSELDPSEP